MERERALKNGMSLYSYTNPSQHSFFISLFVKAGTLYEAASECGITHFFEHVAIRNVNCLCSWELYSSLDALGLEFNASTFPEMVQFYVSGAKEHFEKGAEFLLKLLSPLALSKADVDAERMRVKAEIRESDDKSSLSTFSNSKIYEGTSLAGSIVGRASALNRITLSRLKTYQSEIMTEGNVFLYVTGNVEQRELDFLASRAESYTLGKAKKPRDTTAPVPKDFGKRPPRVYVKGADYTMVRLAFDLDTSLVSGECSDLIYDILLGGYNSKIFIELSERRGLFYDTSGGVDRYSNIGSFYFTFEVGSSKLYEAIELTARILFEMSKKPLKRSECMRAGFVDNAMMLYDDARELNFTFAYDNHILSSGYKTLEDRREAYALVTPEMIRDACAHIFKKENLTLAIKGTKRSVDEERILEIIGRYL